MVYTNYSFTDAISAYARMSTQYFTFPIFCVLGIIVTLIVAFNLENKNGNFVFYTLNIILTGIIIFTKGVDVANNLDIIFKSFLKNSYFYYINTIISFCVVTSIINSKRVSNLFKYVSLGLYCLIIINFTFFIYITNYLSNIEMLVPFNTYPMVYFGNIIEISLYVALFFEWATFMKKKKVHRLGNHL